MVAGCDGARAMGDRCPIPVTRCPIPDNATCRHARAATVRTRGHRCVRRFMMVAARQSPCGACCVWALASALLRWRPVHRLEVSTAKAPNCGTETQRSRRGLPAATPSVACAAHPRRRVTPTRQTSAGATHFGKTTAPLRCTVASCRLNHALHRGASLAATFLIAPPAHGYDRPARVAPIDASATTHDLASEYPCNDRSVRFRPARPRRHPHRHWWLGLCAVARGHVLPGRAGAAPRAGIRKPPRHRHRNQRNLLRHAEAGHVREVAR